MSTEQTQEKKMGIVDKVLGALRDIFAPNLIALMAAGILQGIVILLNTFHVIPPEQAEDFILSNISGAALAWLTGISSWIVPLLLGAFGLFVVMAGGHYTLFPITTQLLATVGYDNIMSPGLLASNLALTGAVAAVLIKTKNREYRSYSLSASVTAALGVSQPGLYGVALPMKNVLIASVLGGAVGGLYAGITQFVFYAFVNPGIAAIPAFISPDGTFTNFINGIITMVISFAVAFLYVMFTPYNELPADQIKEITSED